MIPEDGVYNINFYTFAGVDGEKFNTTFAVFVNNSPLNKYGNQRGGTIYAQHTRFFTAGDLIDVRNVVRLPNFDVENKLVVTSASITVTKIA